MKTIILRGDVSDISVKKASLVARQALCIGWVLPQNIFFLFTDNNSYRTKTCEKTIYETFQ